MSESLEIEFKTMLTETEYHKVCQYFALQEAAFHHQTNCYFDTSQGQLKQHQCGLRIRLLPDQAELTLKSPAPTGLLETTQRFSLAEAESLLAEDQLPKDGPVAAKLQEMGVAIDSLHLIAKLKTKRAELSIPQGLLALDESWYGSAHDFELELEVKEPKQGKIDFTALLQDLSLHYVPAKNKIMRAIQEKQGA